jgi:hypothetical protein
MGKFVFETSTKVDIEDRALAHLEHVITAKLRRGESFTFSWKEDLSVGSGRTTVWVHPHSSIVYKFYGGRAPSISPAWLHALAYTAASPRGLYLVPEPDASHEREAAEPRQTMTFDIVAADA